MVLKTKSCNLLTVDNRSSPRAAMARDVDVDVVEPDACLLLSRSSGTKNYLSLGSTASRGSGCRVGVPSLGQRIGKGMGCKGLAVVV